LFKNEAPCLPAGEHGVLLFVNLLKKVSIL